MKIGCVTVNFLSDKDTLTLISQLSSCSLPPGNSLKIYTVDNSQSKNLREEINKYPLADYVSTESNLGFAIGNNIGIKKALKENSEIIILLNNDTLVKKDFLEKVLTSDIKKDEVGVVGGLIYFAKGFEYEKSYKESDLGKVVWYGGGKVDWDNVYAGHKGVNEVDKGQFKSEETPFITGCLFITKDTVLKRSGLFDERYCLYLEDADLCQRVLALNYKLIFDPSIKMWHKVAQGSGIGSSLNDYFITRNRLLFGFTYAKLRTKLALAREAIRMITKGTDAQKLAIKDFFFGRFGWGSFKSK